MSSIQEAHELILQVPANAPYSVPVSFDGFEGLLLSTSFLIWSEVLTVLKVLMVLYLTVIHRTQSLISQTLGFTSYLSDGRPPE